MSLQQLREDLFKPVSDSPELRFSLLAGCFLQFFLLLLSAMVMDHGVVLHASLQVMVGYLVALLFILIRRHRQPTAADLWFIRWGSLLLTVIAQPIAHWYWRSRGAI
jgi:hypothetical protein